MVYCTNQRCDQENVVEQLKNSVNALRVPLYDLVGAWVYMVIAALAWNLNAWLAPMVHHKSERARYLRMGFRRFLHSIIIPCRGVRRSRSITIRLLGHQPTSDRLFGAWCTIERMDFTRTVFFQAHLPTLSASAPGDARRRVSPPGSMGKFWSSTPLDVSSHRLDFAAGRFQHAQFAHTGVRHYGVSQTCLLRTSVHCITEARLPAHSAVGIEAVLSDIGVGSEADKSGLSESSPVETADRDAGVSGQPEVARSDRTAPRRSRGACANTEA